MINFTDLPSDIKRHIFTINRYRNNYDKFVANFKDKVEGDREIYNDIIYNWKNTYQNNFTNSLKVYHSGRIPPPFMKALLHNDIVAYKKQYPNCVILRMDEIKEAIDDGRVDDF